MSIRRENGTFGADHGLSDHRFYPVWRAMMNRCYNTNSFAYDRYGKRGIEVLREWHDAQVFIEWLEENGYRKGLHIDRIDNDGDYCDDNCRVVSARTNSRNRSDNKRYLVNGEMLLAPEIEEVYGVKAETFRARVERYGQSPDEAIINKRKMPQYEWVIDDEVMSTRDIQDRFGISPHAFTQRVNRGWSAERAAKTPVGG
jgi:hypothetical protein